MWRNRISITRAVTAIAIQRAACREIFIERLRSGSSTANRTRCPGLKEACTLNTAKSERPSAYESGPAPPACLDPRSLLLGEAGEGFVLILATVPAWSRLGRVDGLG